MKALYRVDRKTIGGSWVAGKAPVFTNKRKAKSYAYNWVKDKKHWHRYNSHDRDYGELRATVVGIDQNLGNEFWVAEYT